jgi:hypothetical protein
MPTTNEIYWIAGLLEGEGCFHAQRQFRSYNVLIQLAMTDEDVIERAAKILGWKQRKPCRPRAHQHKTVYSVGICGARALGWMQTVYPLMGKRRQAKIRKILDLVRMPHMQLHLNSMPDVSAGRGA